MRTFLISDIHGCNIAFRKALKSVGLKKTDKLILLGDLIDRGKDSKGVLDTVLLLIESGFDVQCLMGNHEKMLLDSKADINMKVNWIKNGGKETLESFLTSKVENIPDRYIDFMSTFKYYIELEDFILVHAGINMTIEEPFSDLKSLLWQRDWQKFFDLNWLDKRIVFHGHTPMSEIEIEQQFIDRKQVICIDNGSYLTNREGHGSICVLNLETKKLHFER